MYTIEPSKVPGFYDLWYVSRSSMVENKLMVTSDNVYDLIQFVKKVSE